MTGRRVGSAVLLGMLAAAGCADGTPTSEGDDLLPDAETFEVRISWDDFVENLEVFGGFASAADLPSPVVAHEYRDGLEAYALLDFEPFPPAISVVPPDGSTGQPDSSYVAAGGTLVLRLDTLDAPSDAVLEIGASAMSTEWHPASATWGFAVDTIQDRREWSEPGGGPTREIGAGAWFPPEGDSVMIEVDSATADDWVQGGEDWTGVRIESRTPATLLRLISAEFRADLRSDVNPDTTVVLSRSDRAHTVVHDPEPGAGDVGGIRIGGAPARRAYLTLNPPRRIESGPLCSVVPCPLELTPDRVVFAGLVLESVPTEPSAFQPYASMGLDARPALAADRVPRSPLGSPVQPSPRSLDPEAFGPEGSREIEVPMTRYIRDLLRGGESEEEDPVPNTLALHAADEPSGLGYATFRGPGEDGGPVLRIILTLSEGVRLP